MPRLSAIELNTAVHQDNPDVSWCFSKAILTQAASVRRKTMRHLPIVTNDIYLPEVQRCFGGGAFSARWMRGADARQSALSLGLSGTDSRISQNVTLQGDR